jgi:hypothetical protein
MGGITFQVLPSTLMLEADTVSKTLDWNFVPTQLIVRDVIASPKLPEYFKTTDHWYSQVLHFMPEFVTVTHLLSL